MSDDSSAFNRHPQNPNEDELQELLEYFIDRDNEIMALFTGDSYYDKNDSIEFAINYMWWGDELIPKKYNYYRLTIDGINSIRDLIDYCAFDYYDKSVTARSFFYDGDEQPYFVETDRGDCICCSKKNWMRSFPRISAHTTLIVVRSRLKTA